MDVPKRIVGVDVDDPIWPSIQRYPAAMFLTHWDATCSTCSTLLKEKGIGNREGLLWQPIIAIAKLLEEHGVPGLVEEILGLAKDDFYTLNTIKKKLVEAVGKPREVKTKEGIVIDYDARRWLNNDWTGRALKRLGFKEKRKRGHVKEYRLTPSAVESTALRLVGDDVSLLVKGGASGASGASGITDLKDTRIESASIFPIYLCGPALC